MATPLATPADARGPSPLPRRPWFDDRIDRFLLLIFFVGGFALILAIKLAGRSLVSFRGEPVEPRLLAALVAAVLLLVYALVASRTRTFRLHPERLGDNCYYLGLLYTLASLSAALVELERAAPEARGALIESLLASFGVALSSTILGIALRVWFVQMRREIDDLEVELQRDLQTAAQKLKDQLLFAVTELETFRLRTGQVLEERLDEATGAFVASAERQAEAIRDLAAEVARSVGDAVAPLAERVRAFGEAAGQLTGASEDLAGRIRAVEVPPDLVSRPARRLADAVGRISASVEKLETAGERLASGFEGRVEEVARQLAALGDVVARTAAGLDAAARAGSGLGLLAHEVEPARAKLGEFASALDQLVAAARKDAEEVRGLRDQLRADLAEYQRLQQKLGRALVEVSETIIEKLEG